MNALSFWVVYLRLVSFLFSITRITCFSSHSTSLRFCPPPPCTSLAFLWPNLSSMKHSKPFLLPAWRPCLGSLIPSSHECIPFPLLFGFDFHAIPSFLEIAHRCSPCCASCPRLPPSIELTIAAHAGSRLSFFLILPLPTPLSSLFCSFRFPLPLFSPHSPRPPLSSVCLFTFRSLSVPFLYLHLFFCLGPESSVGKAPWRGCHATCASCHLCASARVRMHVHVCACVVSLSSHVC